MRSAPHTPLNLSADEFRALGHDLVDRIAEFLASLPERPVTRASTPKEIRARLGAPGLPERGEDPGELLRNVADLMFEHSLHNGHPRFLGYITSSAAPLGALAEMLAAAVNSNVGAWELSPVASEIERQLIRWLAELIGYPSDCGGLMVSGGNVANLIGFFAARRAKTAWDVRTSGLYADGRRLTVYASEATHTWIQKAADLSGIGTENIRWIGTDARQRLRLDELERRIEADSAANRLPFIAVGAAGTVGTGAVDPLPAMAAVCRRHRLWFHVDGAYGAPAAALPGAGEDLRGLALADSLALDPHKWLYNPLEAGCALVRDPRHLTGAFSFHPDYYRFEADDDDPRVNFYEHGIQNSRGFRALKVWLSLRAVGKTAYVAMLERDIALAGRLYDAAEKHPELEAFTRELSITTFRYRPADLAYGGESVETYLNELNERLLGEIQSGGEAYVSNAVLAGRTVLRSCIVNFRTTESDIDALPEIVTRLGRSIDGALRPDSLR
ncbi:MAG TPA: pyridoxal-dependent decarboxylase [Gammaproteobacteria bacterium]|jgi:glutamate/tyrosine decarboxylase-like PLP-dependent enzyme